MSDRKDGGWADREWTAKSFKDAKSPETLPEPVLKAFPKTRGPQKKPTKVPTSLRLSPSVLEYYKAQGKGWQTRLDRDLIELHGLDKSSPGQ